LKKRLISIITFVLITAILVACGNEETTTFEQEEDGAHVSADVIHNDEEVSKMEQTTTMNYEDVGVDKDTLKEVMEEQMKAIEDKDGVEVNEDYGDEELEQTVTITIADVDMDDLQDIVGDSGDKDDDYVDFEEVKELLEDDGFEIKE